jgi:hypothetical protein
MAQALLFVLCLQGRQKYNYGIYAVISMYIQSKLAAQRKLQIRNKILPSFLIQFETNVNNHTGIEDLNPQITGLPAQL